MMFALVEKTRGPWLGRVWRCEDMTADEADCRNAKISVMQWEPCSEEGLQNDGGSDSGDAWRRSVQ